MIPAQMLGEAQIWPRMVKWNVMQVLWMVILEPLELLELYQVVLNGSNWFEYT